MSFHKKIVDILAKETKLKSTELSTLLTTPPDSEMGDYAFPCFKLGKDSKKEAEKLKKKIKLPKWLSRVENVGPYLNFFINQVVLAEETLKKVKKEKKEYGSGKEKKKIVVEFCGPNTNKPLHLGHVRNMALGHSVCQVLSCLGNKLRPVNIVNDRGIHICQSMLAYQKWGKNKKPNKKGDHFVGDYYVLFSKKADGDLKAEAQELLLKWESKDPKVMALWKKMNSWVLDGFKETYQRFGIKFEKEYFESAYYEKGKELVEEGLRKNVFRTVSEAKPVKFGETTYTSGTVAETSSGPKFVLRGDETSIYVTQDMYLADLRYNDFKFDQMVYVVASEQNLHFKQLFEILEKLGRKYAKNLYHLSYGLVHLPSGRMKSREGTVVDADDIMDEVVSLAEKEVKKRHKSLTAKETKKRAEMIGLGAIKFFMLKIDANRDMVFNPEESLSFEGETGPYVQYTHARACSILRKAKSEQKMSVSDKVKFEILNLSEDSTLIRLLYQFPEVLLKVGQTYKPHHLAQYLISLSQAFNEFYHKCPVICERDQDMKARLLLVDSVRQVLENGLGLLGIKAPEEM